jgi:EamA domain-containing membrane protein RarD
VVNYLFNKEKLKILEIISIFSAMIGVIIYSNPTLILPKELLSEDQI